MSSPRQIAAARETCRIRNERWRATIGAGEFRKCTACKTPKPRNEFGRNHKVFDGCNSWCVPCTRKYNREKLRKILVQSKRAAYEKLGNVCVRCGFSDERALQIDHINGDGNMNNGRPGKGKRVTSVQIYKAILREGETRFQILCANCNWIKRHENGEHVKRCD